MALREADAMTHAQSVAHDAADIAESSGWGDNRLTALIRALDLSVRRVELAAHDFATVAKAAEPSSLKLADVEGSISDALGNIESDRDRITREQDEIRDYVAKATRYRQLLDQAGGSPSQNLQDQLALLGSELESKQPSIRNADKDLAEFKNAHADDLKVLDSAAADQRRVSQEIKPFQAKMSAAANRLDTTIEDARDAYCSLANHLTKLANTEPSSRNHDFAEKVSHVNSFFADEQDRVLQDDLATAKETLSDRDNAMVNNTAHYMETLSTTSVAVVVGYAHLSDVSDKLQSKGIDVVAVAFKGTGFNEPWEVLAERARAEGGVPDFFLRVIEKRLNKSPLLIGSQEWLEYESYVVKSLQDGNVKSIGLAPGETRTVFRAPELADPRISYGSQVVMSGPTLDASQYFEVWDRDIGRKQARKLSDARTAFAYAYQIAVGDEKEWRVYSQGREQSFQSFKNVPPPPGIDYVVWTGEPDEVLENGVFVRETWNSLVDSGGKNPPPPTGRSWSAFADPDDHPDRRITLVSTRNPERAKANIAEIRGQRSLRPDQVDVVDFTDADGDGQKQLANLPFATKLGEAAGLVVILAHNTTEFRKALTRAAEEGKLKGKQVALVTCGDAFKETTALRETILSHGALMVWNPHHQISESVGRDLKTTVSALLSASSSKRRSYKNIDELMHASISSMISKDSENADIAPLKNAGSYVQVEPISDWSLGARRYSS
jgi:hypothetical protein